MSHKMCAASMERSFRIGENRRYVTCDLATNGNLDIHKCIVCPFIQWILYTYNLTQQNHYYFYLYLQHIILFLHLIV